MQAIRIKKDVTLIHITYKFLTKGVQKWQSKQTKIKKGFSQSQKNNINIKKKRIYGFHFRKKCIAAKHKKVTFLSVKIFQIMKTIITSTNYFRKYFCMNEFFAAFASLLKIPQNFKIYETFQARTK